MKTLRDLLDTECREALDPAEWERDLQRSVHPQEHPDAARAVSMMPGEDVQQHLLYRKPNPYWTRPRSELKALLNSQALDPAQERLIREALSMQERS